MSRQAFEAWCKDHHAVDWAIDLAWQSWQAATDAALERAAKVCEKLGTATNGIYERNQECAEAIRALKDKT